MVMFQIDVVDEAITDSPAIVIFNAVINEHKGTTHWWMPYWESKLRARALDHEGVVFDITVHGRHTPRFSARITRVEEGKLIEMENEGDFAGTGTWTFEPTDGKTKVRFRWNVKPKRLSFILVSPFIDMGKIHSDVMQEGFKALNSYLGKK
jgi:hypothetical protein